MNNCSQKDEVLCGDVNQMWAEWKNQFMGIMDQCIPTSVLPPKQNLCRLNSDIIRSICDGNSVQRKVVNSNKWKTIRGSEIRSLTCETLYFMNLESNSKAFWKVTKLLTKQPTTIPILQDDGGNIIRDDKKPSFLMIFLQMFQQRATVAKKIRL